MAHAPASRSGRSDALTRPAATTFERTAYDLIRTSNCLWRVDDHREDDVLVASTVDGGEAQQLKLSTLFEDIESGQGEPPSINIVGQIQAPERFLRANHLTLLEGAAPAPRLRCSRAIGEDKHSMATVTPPEMARVRYLMLFDELMGSDLFPA